MKHPKCLTLLGLIFILAACGVPELTTPRPTPEAIKVYYPASLHAWADQLATCAINVPQVALYLIESASLPANMTSNDFVLELGQPPQGQADSHLFQVGQDQVAVIVNTKNSLSQIPTEKLRQIFAGAVLNWESPANQPIQVWVLPAGEPARETFDQAVLQDQGPAPEARLAPNPTAVIEAVSGDDSAIGYVPVSFLSTLNSTVTIKVKSIQVEASLARELNMPVLAVMLNEPGGNQRNLLVCLQNSGLN